ncbi:putative UDP-Gal or UDP-GlcNAc-dependent glycosyltransferase, partial [Trypanosoma grayi]|uniref:putative UDP-Gal or UDP-GlcNAc-dependent glycosyltransferase n=1 Tax=Trypanosoma grayi TaxID=71804 RepID=UPI0004F43BDE
GVYWGVPCDGIILKGNVTHKCDFFNEIMYTLAMDVVPQFVSFEPVRRLAHLSYSKEREEQFFQYSMTAEDVMVGQILRLEVQYPALVVVEDSWRRFHFARSSSGRFVVRPISLVLHLSREADYLTLMHMFCNDTSYRKSVWKRRRQGVIRLHR